jgi:probable phosphomutase (TIGR03848 family)
MTTFLLVRHAATDLVGRTIAGWMPGVHLNQEGRAQAERLAGRLTHVPIAAVYSSPLERARETAAPLATRLGLQVQIREGIGEIHFGEWTGRDFRGLAQVPKWRQFNLLRGSTRIPGGEFMLGVQARMVAELERLRERHPGDVVAVVSHGDVIKAAVGHYAGIPLDLLQRVEISPASVSVVAVNDYGPQILRINDTGELPSFVG